MIISGLKSFGNYYLSSYLKNLRHLSYKSEISKSVDEYHKTNSITESSAGEVRYIYNFHITIIVLKENNFGEIKIGCRCFYFY